MGNQNAFTAFIEFIFFVLSAGLLFYMFSFFIVALPSVPNQPNLYDPIYTVFTTFYAFLDKSFVFLFIIMMLASVVTAYLDPKIRDGIADIILLIGFAYLSLNINIWWSAFQVAQIQTFFPLTYAFMSSIYPIIIVFVCLAFSIIFNFRIIENTQNKQTVVVYGGIKSGGDISE